MRNTRKNNNNNNNSNNITKKNKINKCMETFTKNRINKLNKQMDKWKNKKLNHGQQNIPIESKKTRNDTINTYKKMCALLSIMGVLDVQRCKKIIFLAETKKRL